ncbi:Uncharacterised protein [Neisseria meningitidis]|nr:Uncharacterised protein [Neisseria meningitidis]
MSTEYVGSVILYLGANEVQVTKIDVKDNTGKKPVKTMNRTRRVKGLPAASANTTLPLPPWCRPTARRWTGQRSTTPKSA